jgi:zinc protease
MKPRTAFALIVTALLGFGGAGIARSQPSAPITPAARAAWGLDQAGLQPHPGVRLGVLANGMRLALMPNAAPAGGLSVRLHIDAGAAVEGAREQGFMHLIEHMIFHGSRNIPEGALPVMLARGGLTRWTDFSAYTTYDETVYRLELGRADIGARGTALLLMREIADRLRFTDGNVAGAKLKVREEIEGRDAVQDRLTSAQNSFLLPGTSLDRGPVAGGQADVRRADPDGPRRLYGSWYVPGRATLVLVGDFDPALVESEIAARFSDWRAGGAEGAPQPPGAVRAGRGIEARAFIDRAAPTAVTIASVRAIGGAGDSGADRDERFLAGLGSEMLGRRLARLARAPHSPLTGATAAIYDHFSAARVASLDLAANERDWRGALRLGAAELRRAIDGGFTQAELAEQLAGSRRGLAASSAPRTSPALADAIVDAVGRGLVFTQPGNPAAADAYLAQVRLAAVNAAFRAAWASADRLIFVSHDRPVPRAQAAIRETWLASFDAPTVAGPTPRAAVVARPGE